MGPYSRETCLVASTRTGSVSGCLVSLMRGGGQTRGDFALASMAGECCCAKLGIATTALDIQESDITGIQARARSRSRSKLDSSAHLNARG